MQLTGAEIVIECLKEQGVDTVFGYPGGTILNIYDELYKHSNKIITYSHPMSRVQPMQRTAMPVPQGKWVCVLQPAAPAPPTW